MICSCTCIHFFLRFVKSQEHSEANTFFLFLSHRKIAICKLLTSATYFCRSNESQFYRNVHSAQNQLCIVLITIASSYIRCRFTKWFNFPKKNPSGEWFAREFGYIFYKNRSAFNNIEKRQKNQFHVEFMQKTLFPLFHIILNPNCNFYLYCRRSDFIKWITVFQFQWMIFDMNCNVVRYKII